MPYTLEQFANDARRTTSTGHIAIATRRSDGAIDELVATEALYYFTRISTSRSGACDVAKMERGSPEYSMPAMLKPWPAQVLMQDSTVSPLLSAISVVKMRPCALSLPFRSAWWCGADSD